MRQVLATVRLPMLITRADITRWSAHEVWSSKGALLALTTRCAAAMVINDCGCSRLLTDTWPAMLQHIHVRHRQQVISIRR